jgi:hypothetical protein
MLAANRQKVLLYLVVFIPLMGAGRVIARVRRWTEDGRWKTEGLCCQNLVRE